ncbi:MAG: replicative DNA helicase [Christensenellaceae bacterium]|jgi:replicative DNA helicase|nr:replicative DNA helicase [Christensenellaceae bacterium]
MAEINTKHKVPPSNIEAEKSILCCFLIDPIVVNEICDMMSEDFFVIDRHKSIFTAIRELHAEGSVVDLIVVNDQLAKNKQSEIEMFDYLVKLTDFIPSSANYKSYYTVLYRDYLLRRIINTCGEGIEGAFKTDDPLLLVNQITQKLYEINSIDKRGSFEHISKGVDVMINRLNASTTDKTGLRGVPTGFPLLDNVTSGLQKGDLIILAARPSVGKTSFALNIAANLLQNKNESDRKRVCAIFSIEMPAEQLAQRMVSSLEDIDMYSLSNASIVQVTSDQEKLWNAARQLKRSRIYVDDSSTQTPGSIFAKCQKVRTTQGQLDLVIVDYLQLMSLDISAKSRSSGNKVQEVAEISRTLKVMARDLSCPVVVLSQMSRGIEMREASDKQPKLSDLRDSGAIEQDADIVMFLSRVKEEEKSYGEYDVTLSIAKHRNGQLKDILYRWFGKFVRFQEHEMTKDGTTPS